MILINLILLFRMGSLFGRDSETHYSLPDAETADPSDGISLTIGRKVLLRRSLRGGQQALVLDHCDGSRPTSSTHPSSSIHLKSRLLNYNLKIYS